MKKLLALLLILALLIPVFAACGGDESSKSTTKNTNTEKTTQSVPSQTIPPQNVPNDKDPTEDGLFDGFYVFKPNADNSGYVVAEYTGKESNIVIPKEYNGKPVTEIGSNAFAWVACESITIPNSVTSISEYAFSDNGPPNNTDTGCTAKYIKFEEGIKLKSIEDNTFFACKKLEKIEIPDGVRTIGFSAFEYCYALEEIKIPESVTTIKGGAFDRCQSLKSIKLPSKLTEIGQNTFRGCKKLEAIEIPDGVQIIDKNAFSECESLVSVELSDGLLEIMENAFSDCISLKNIEFPEGLLSIKASAFAWCEALETVNIPASLSELDYPFFGCTSLKNITVKEENNTYSIIENCLVDTKNKALMYAGENAVIPSDGSVEFISGNAFQGFPEVASIHIPKSVERIDYKAFRNCTGIESITCDDENEYFYVVNNCLIEKGTKKLFVGCNNSIIPNDGSVEIIGAYSFNNRRIKSDFSLPEGITVIEDSAFMDCTGIGGVDLPSTVTTIDDTAFQNSDIVSVSIPLGIKKLGSVFSGCKSLTTAVLPEGLEELDTTFSDCSSLVNVNIPSTVKTLRGAFYGTAIKSISLPEGLQNLVMLTFASCTELESIELPKSLTLIGPAIFSDCTNLISIKYNGTVADWEKVDKYSGPFNYRFNDRLYEVAIKCTDGEVLTEKPE